jgi:hypothetical protein
MGLGVNFNPGCCDCPDRDQGEGDCLFLGDDFDNGNFAIDTSTAGTGTYKVWDFRNGIWCYNDCGSPNAVAGSLVAETADALAIIDKSMSPYTIGGFPPAWDLVVKFKNTDPSDRGGIVFDYVNDNTFGFCIAHFSAIGPNQTESVLEFYNRVGGTDTLIQSFSTQFSVDPGTYSFVGYFKYIPESRRDPGRAFFSATIVPDEIPALGNPNRVFYGSVYRDHNGSTNRFGLMTDGIVTTKVVFDALFGYIGEDSIYADVVGLDDCPTRDTQCQVKLEDLDQGAGCLANFTGDTGSYSCVASGAQTSTGSTTVTSNFTFPSYEDGMTASVDFVITDLNDRPRIYTNQKDSNNHFFAEVRPATRELLIFDMRTGTQTHLITNTHSDSDFFATGDKYTLSLGLYPYAAYTGDYTSPGSLIVANVIKTNVIGSGDQFAGLAAYDQTEWHDEGSKSGFGTGTMAGSAVFSDFRIDLGASTGATLQCPRLAANCDACEGGSAPSAYLIEFVDFIEVPRNTRCNETTFGVTNGRQDPIPPINNRSFVVPVTSPCIYYLDIEDQYVNSNPAYTCGKVRILFFTGSNGSLNIFNGDVTNNPSFEVYGINHYYDIITTSAPENCWFENKEINGYVQGPGAYLLQQLGYRPRVYVTAIYNSPP